MITILDHKLADTAENHKIKAVVEALLILTNPAAAKADQTNATQVLMQCKNVINVLTENKLSVGVILASRNLQAAAELYLLNGGDPLYLAMGAAYGNHIAYANKLIAELGEARLNLSFLARWAAYGGHSGYANELINRKGGDAMVNLNDIAICAILGGHIEYAQTLQHRSELVQGAHPASPALINVPASSFLALADPPHLELPPPVAEAQSFRNYGSVFAASASAAVQPATTSITILAMAVKLSAAQTAAVPYKQRVVTRASAAAAAKSAGSNDQAAPAPAASTSGAAAAAPVLAAKRVRR